jgi:hypothetical protein
MACDVKSINKVIGSNQKGTTSQTSRVETEHST